MKKLMCVFVGLFMLVSVSCATQNDDSFKPVDEQRQQLLLAFTDGIMTALTVAFSGIPTTDFIAAIVSMQEYDFTYQEIKETMDFINEKRMKEFEEKQSREGQTNL